MAVAGKAINSASRKMNASYLILLRFAGMSGRETGWNCGLDTIFFHAAIQSAAAQTERLRRMADIAGMPCQGLLDQQQFYFFQAHIFYFGRTSAVTFKP